MKRSFNGSNGYLDTVQQGMAALRRMDLRLSRGKGSREEQLARLREELKGAEALLVGAGAGLSTSAGLTYSGERFRRYFFDFARAYGIRDMYSGGFFPFPRPEILWAWWARHIYYNRYIDPPKPVYPMLRDLLGDKEYFVITTNVDHQFRRAGFDKRQLFYTQGDYGLFQPAGGVRKVTYDNEEWTLKAMEAQGFIRDEEGIFQPPADRRIRMEIPTELIPKAPDGGEVTMNLRSDGTFVEDEGWHRAAAAYGDFVCSHREGRILYLELGVGSNTPMIVKYPFWQMTADNPRAVYACLNFGEAYCPREIEDRSVCLDGDIGDILNQLKEERE